MIWFAVIFMALLIGAFAVALRIRGHGWAYIALFIGLAGAMTFGYWKATGVIP